MNNKQYLLRSLFYILPYLGRSAVLGIDTVFVGNHEHFNFNINLTGMEKIADVLTLRFQPSYSDKHTVDVMDIDTGELSATVELTYEDRVITIPDYERRKLKITLVDCTPADTGTYICVLNKRVLQNCGYKLYILDLKTISTPFNKDIKMSFDISNIPNIISTVIIMFRRDGEEKWLEVLKIKRPGLDVNVNALYTRPFHHVRGKGTIEITMTQVTLADSGYYGCFSIAAEVYIPHCGYHVIVLDLKGVSIVEGKTVIMIFHLKTVIASRNPEVVIKMKQVKHVSFKTVFTVNMEEFSVVVAKPYETRVSAQPDIGEKYIYVNLHHVTLADTGDYRCFVESGEVQLAGCGYHLTVYVEESEDNFQVNSIENRNVELVFNIVPVVSDSNHVRIVFQHKSSEHPGKTVMTVSLQTLKSKVTNEYAPRVLVQHVSSGRSLRIQLSRVTIEDDGVYLCLLGTSFSIIPGCFQKLNVFVADLKHVVAKGWDIFKGDTFSAICDRYRFPYPAAVESVTDIVLRKRVAMESDFFPIATYKPKSGQEITFDKPADRTWTIHAGGGNSPATISLVVNFTDADTEDSGEYECASYVTTKSKSLVLYSLYSRVTVHRLDEPEFMVTNMKPTESTKDLSEIAAEETSLIILLFESNVMETQHDIVIIKFRAPGETDWKDIAEITKSSLQFKLLVPEKEAALFSGHLSKSSFTLTIDNATKDMAGVYRCFAGTFIVSILESCGYTLSILDLPSPATAFGDVTTTAIAGETTTLPYVINSDVGRTETHKNETDSHKENHSTHLKLYHSLWQLLIGLTSQSLVIGLCRLQS